MLGEDGTAFRAYPIPCAYIADIMERNVILNQKAFPADFPDARCMVPKHELDKPLHRWPERTELDTRKVRCALNFVCSSTFAMLLMQGGCTSCLPLQILAQYRNEPSLRKAKHLLQSRSLLYA